MFTRPPRAKFEKSNKVTPQDSVLFRIIRSKRTAKQVGCNANRLVHGLLAKMTTPEGCQLHPSVQWVDGLLGRTKRQEGFFHSFHCARTVKVLFGTGCVCAH